MKSLKYSKTNLTMAALVFLLVFLCSSLTRIDETPCENSIPPFVGPFVFLGFLFEMPLIQIVFFVHITNFLSNKIFGWPIINYEWYFLILPWITAGFYSFLTLVITHHKTKKV